MLLQKSEGAVFKGIKVQGHLATAVGRNNIICSCHCGNWFIVNLVKLYSGHTKSCGCRQWKTENLRGVGPTAKTYRIWGAMKQRCFNPKDKVFHNYGARGISVCEAWEDFDVFLSDMGLCPPKFSIERINVNGDYCKENCKWIPRGAQLRNTRRNVILTFQGERMIASDACERAEINRVTFYVRRCLEKKRGSKKSDQEIFDELAGFH